MRFSEILNKSIFKIFIIFPLKTFFTTQSCIFVIECIFFKSCLNIFSTTKLINMPEMSCSCILVLFFEILAAIFLKRIFSPFLVIRYRPTFDMLISGKFATRNSLKTFSCNLFRVRPFFS